ncbi:hypothetical protein RhiirA4_462010 [Rhizophagus irregularis]|uniref:Protein kinase domain-containing protein n=1 Tax=Rhizophagus irregularis TaxID=588596 RepID=A0A2I1GK15_9GLOM|nr:hypothetical protein RhiirA4_462010 [Rhizophagus irregularis]
MNDRYLKYFEKSSKYWSLEDFDSWSLNNIEHCQHGLTHRVFYKYLNMISQESSSKRKIKITRQLVDWLEKRDQPALFWMKEIFSWPLWLALDEEGRFEKDESTVETPNELKRINEHESGFSEIYTADWINGRYDEWDSEKQLLKRIGTHKAEIVRCYGLTQNLTNGNFMLVMNKMTIDSRKYLQQNHSQLTWRERIEIAFAIINSLCFIIIAPGKDYTFKSDIYSIAILMWEISSGQSPFIIINMMITTDYLQVHQFENLPEPRNAMEEEQEDSSEILHKEFKKLQLNFNNSDEKEIKEIMEAIQQQIKKQNIDINDDGDEINNSNLHLEEQEELENSANIY